MTLPKVYVVDDLPENRDKVTAAVASWKHDFQELLKDPDVVSELDEHDMAVLKRLDASAPDVEFLLTGYINPTRLSEIEAGLLTTIAQPAILLLDYQLQKNAGANDEDNFVKIVTAFRPSKNRVLCIASSWSTPMTVARRRCRNHLSFIVQGCAMASSGAAALLGGIAKWLKMNERLYDKFVDELWAIDPPTGHGQGEGGSDKSNVFYTCVGEAANSHGALVQKVLHPLTMERPASFHALWLLSRVAQQEILPERPSEFRGEWSQFSSVDVPINVPWDMACFPKQTRDDRKRAVLLFGELCRKLFLSDSTRHHAGAGSPHCTLTGITVTRGCFKINVDFLPHRDGASHMAKNVAAGVNYLLGVWGSGSKSDAVKHLCISAGVVHHEVSDVILACWMAFRVVGPIEAREHGEDFLGGARLSVSEHMQGNSAIGTEVCFHV